MSQSRLRNFITGALLGVGLGILFAPHEGSITRKKLKESFDELSDTVKNIDIEETKEEIIKRIENIKKQLSSIKIEDAKRIMAEKKELIEEKCDSIIYDVEASTIPTVIETTKKVKNKSNKFLDDVIDELEANTPSGNTKKTTTSKKKTTTKKPTTKKKTTSTKKSKRKKAWFSCFFIRLML